LPIAGGSLSRYKKVDAGQKPWQTTDTQMFYDRLLAAGVHYSMSIRLFLLSNLIFFLVNQSELTLLTECEFILFFVGG